MDLTSIQERRQDMFCLAVWSYRLIAILIAWVKVMYSRFVQNKLISIETSEILVLRYFGLVHQKNKELFSKHTTAFFAFEPERLRLALAETEGRGYDSQRGDCPDFPRQSALPCGLAAAQHVSCDHRRVRLWSRLLMV